MRHVSRGAPRVVEPIGRIGHAARAVVFLLIGWSIVQSAWAERSSGVMGLGEAIMALGSNGPVYSLVAVGLILFGMFSLIVARYRIIPDLGHGLRRPRFRA
ncbi:DUF1206 domain-containing protein [Leptolyngbya sp. 15MV]|nr:DUF1206 domain-containing protein [Leptolyngbya sp. 15MV]